MEKRDRWTCCCRDGYFLQSFLKELRFFVYANAYLRKIYKNDGSVVYEELR